MLTELREIQALTEGYLDGAPDRSEASRLAERVHALASAVLPQAEAVRGLVEAAEGSERLLRLPALRTVDTDHERRMDAAWTALRAALSAVREKGDGVERGRFMPDDCVAACRDGVHCRGCGCTSLQAECDGCDLCRPTQYEKGASDE